MARKLTDYIIIHRAATPARMDGDIKAVDRWHRERGFRMVGYHYFIKRDGTLQPGRELMNAGAHATGYNEKSVGICLAGGLAEDKTTPEANFTTKQWEALQALVSVLQEKFPKAQVIGHSDVANKACPCFDVKEWWKQQRTPPTKAWHQEFKYK